MGVAYFVRVKDHSGATNFTVTPENLGYSMNLNQPHTINFEISLDRLNDIRGGLSDAQKTNEGDAIGAYQHDWQLVRNGVVVPEMAGLITSLNIPEGEEHIEVNGQSWLHYLDRRHYPFAYPPFSDSHFFLPIPVQRFHEDITEILWRIFNGTLAREHSLDINVDDLGFDPDTETPSRTTFKDNYEIDFGDTESILSKIQDLAEGKKPDCFDFGIDEDKNFWLRHPEYSDPEEPVWRLTVAVPSNITIQDESSALIDRGTTWTDNGPRGTHIIGTGTAPVEGNAETDVNGNPAAQRGYAMGSEDGQQLFRRLDFTESFGSAASPKRIERLTGGALRAGVRPQREVPIKVVPEAIRDFFDLFRPGNYFLTNIPLTGGHVITGTKKITSIEVSVDEAGNEEATIHNTLWENWFGVENVENQI